MSSHRSKPSQAHRSNDRLSRAKRRLNGKHGGRAKGARSRVEELLGKVRNEEEAKA